MHPLFTPSAHITLSSYLLWMSFTFCICVYYFYKRAPSHFLSSKLAASLSLWIMMGGFFGARLFHVVLEYPDYYIASPSEIFKFWNGGFVYYGGLAGGFLGAWLFMRQKHQIMARWLDHAAPVLALGYGIGRLGCLWAGCCYGKICDLPWAITFGPNVEAPAFVPVHPTQVYAFLYELCVYAILIYLEKKKALQKMGSVFYTWMILHGTGRMWIEQYRADFRGPEFFGFSVSTYISLLLVSLGLFLLLGKTPTAKATTRA